MPDPAALQWGLAERLAYPAILETEPSPDGRHVLFVVQEPLLADDKSEMISHLYLATAEGGETQQLTFGEAADSTPRWSPDGRHIAFLSERSGKANVYIMRASGGEAWALTKYDKTDVQGLRWSPDGKRLAFRMAVPPSEEKEKARKARDDAKVWSEDHDFAHLFVMPFSVGPRTPPEARQLTRGRFHVVDFDWTPDGRRLALAHQPTPLADTWPETRLAVILAEGGDGTPLDLAALRSWNPRPLVSPDGRWVACFRGDEPARWAFSGRIALYPLPREGERAEGDVRPLADTPDEQPQLLGWSSDGREVYALEANGTLAQVWALPPSGEPARALTDDPVHKSVAAANAAGQIAYAGQTLEQPNAVYLLDATTGHSRRLAQPPLPPDWPKAPLPRAEVLRWRAPDGLEIEGILVYPLDYQPGWRYPLLVQVHGGPTGVFSRSYLGALGTQADAAALAERGYALLRPNPRGSGGYGRDFRFANYGDWGGGDYQDIMAGVDNAIALGVADPDRLGVLGWSYGGFMTSWIITQTRRFKAACVGAGVTDLVSFNGTSDIPGFVPDYFGGEFWDDLDTYRRHSPVLQAKGVATPTLVLHGENDVRVPLGQGREFYNALQRQGVPTELVIYPRQGHGNFEPRLRLDVLRRVLDWFAHWIPA